LAFYIKGDSESDDEENASAAPRSTPAAGHSVETNLMQVGSLHS